MRSGLAALASAWVLLGAGGALGERDVPRRHQAGSATEGPTIAGRVVSELQVAGGRRGDRDLRIFDARGCAGRLVIGLGRFRLERRADGGHLPLQLRGSGAADEGQKSEDEGESW